MTGYVAPRRLINFCKQQYCLTLQGSITAKIQKE